MPKTTATTTAIVIVRIVIVMACIVFPFIEPLYVVSMFNTLVGSQSSVFLEVSISTLHSSNKETVELPNTPMENSANTKIPPPACHAAPGRLPPFSVPSGLFAASCYAAPDLLPLPSRSFRGVLLRCPRPSPSPCIGIDINSDMGICIDIGIDIGICIG